MSDIKEPREKVPDADSNIGLEALMEKAELLLEEDCFDEAITLLKNVEARYVDCVRVFDLLGEALKCTGNNYEAIRYRTLHEVLRGTFGILQETRIHEPENDADLPTLRTAPQTRRRKTEDRVAQAISVHGPTTPLPESHRTLSMAQEFVRQGQYDKALELLDELAEKDPGNQAIVYAKESAVKKRNEKHVLTVLQKWLNNLDAVKNSDV